MNRFFEILDLPHREIKPRNKGMSIIIDNGIPLSIFKAHIEETHEYIDFVKFGWGTSVISKSIHEKIKILENHRIDFFFGGTLFEKFYSKNKLAEFITYCKQFGTEYVEISNGTIDLTNTKKASIISDLSKEFKVFSEVGFKDSNRSEMLSTNEWIDYIEEDLRAGALKVITEARESGTSGICNEKGELKEKLISKINDSFDIKDIIFEAPNKNLQGFFIKKIGAHANLANIPFDQVIALETLRLGLRSDTLLHFES